ncbi:(2Fe-2S)-binding protein [Psychromonas hadalis]|uniref:(2Fe-2S)-binding protein n=1 Tax=Psychromonas hadalis TaxID=211669 RepID=UPI00146E1751|nr:hypothetical protein [Psychromonas hadalis]
MSNQRTMCTCHNIARERFQSACEQGAQSVKSCFKQMGCMPKCSDCIPMVRAVLAQAKKTS